ncbi:hypothetical protein KKB44_00750 [Candidatus Micrarchaeota archaeon]|nr:hypothetical protein [Candidatus Micrarchaeota archaeon]
MEETDPDLKEAIEACAKIIEAKCKKRPYMIVISKADVGFASKEEHQKGILRGKASYMYMARPTIRPDGISKVLIGASKKALEMAEKEASGKS